mmetsp:Transcript_41375/g.64623  ORF Transcript_41375/g.64623 Transcript_41375/m.64623 type:complete len:147 (+) Transcript_41375:66-506(+)
MCRSAGKSDGPDIYMQKVVSDLLSPAFETINAGPLESTLVHSRVVTVTLEALLKHLLNIKARISSQGAQRLQQDIAYVKNWLATSPLVPQERRSELRDLAIFIRTESVLQILLPPKLQPDQLSKSPLPDAQQWAARRSRTKRGLFC